MITKSGYNFAVVNKIWMGCQNKIKNVLGYLWNSSWFSDHFDPRRRYCKCLKPENIFLVLLRIGFLDTVGPVNVGKVEITTNNKDGIFELGLNFFQGTSKMMKVGYGGFWWWSVERSNNKWFTSLQMEFNPQELGGFRFNNVALGDNSFLTMMKTPPFLIFTPETRIPKPGGVISAVKMLSFRCDSVRMMMSGLWKSMKVSSWGSYHTGHRNLWQHTANYSYEAFDGG